MPVSKLKIFFSIAIDDSLTRLDESHVGGNKDNERVLSLLNDYEDGRWRHDQFQNFVFDHLSETCLSKDERDSLIGSPLTCLKEAVRKLRLLDSKSSTEGSELAEALLYGIMRRHYGAIPAVPKIFYKQNVNDNAKGADSVHICVCLLYTSDAADE